MIKLMSPAEFAIKQFGGARPLGRAIGASDQIAFRWKRPRMEGSNGCGGQIPTKFIKRILEVAIARGIDLTANDLVYGRTIEVEEITVEHVAV